MLKDKIKADTIEAQKSRNELIVGTLRMLSAAIFSKEKEKRYKISKEKPDATEDQLIKESGLTDEQITETLCLLKSKKEKMPLRFIFRATGRRLADKESKEIDILKKYLPKQLSDEELRKLVAESIAKTGASEIKDMGKIMADLIPKVKGKADGGEISKIIKELLNKTK